MALEDFLEPEVAVAVAATAALGSPQVRGVLRRGVVYGLAGVLMAGDAISTLARGVRRGVEHGMQTTSVPIEDESTATEAGLDGGLHTNPTSRSRRGRTTHEGGLDAV